MYVRKIHLGETQSPGVHLAQGSAPKLPTADPRLPTAAPGSAAAPRYGNLSVVVIVKSCVKKQAGSWLAIQEWTTNKKPIEQVDPTLDNDYNS